MFAKLLEDEALTWYRSTDAVDNLPYHELRESFLEEYAERKERC